MSGSVPPAIRRRRPDDRGPLLKDIERLLSELIGRFITLTELERQESARQLWQQATPLLKRIRRLVRAQQPSKPSKPSKPKRKEDT